MRETVLDPHLSLGPLSIQTVWKFVLPSLSVKLLCACMTLFNDWAQPEYLTCNFHWLVSDHLTHAQQIPSQSLLQLWVLHHKPFDYTILPTKPTFPTISMETLEHIPMSILESQWAGEERKRLWLQVMYLCVEVDICRCYGFGQLDTNLDLLWKREYLQRHYLYQAALWACVRLISCLLIDVGEPCPLWVVPSLGWWALALRKGTEQTAESKLVSSFCLLSLFQFCLQDSVLTILIDGQWCKTISCIKLYLLPKTHTKTNRQTKECMNKCF